MVKRGRPPKSFGTKLYTMYVYRKDDTFTVNVAGTDISASGDDLPEVLEKIGTILSDSDVNEMAKLAE